MFLWVSYMNQLQTETDNINKWTEKYTLTVSFFNRFPYLEEYTLSYIVLLSPLCVVPLHHYS